MAGMVTPERRKLAVKLLEILPSQALHAGKLSFKHPVTQKNVEFEAPLPENYMSVLDLFEIDNYRAKSDTIEMGEND